MIYYFTPYSIDKNLADAYGKCMAMLEDDDWAIFTDGDAMFTVPEFGHIIAHTLKEGSIYTCLTNRVSCLWQVSKCEGRIEDHRLRGRSLADKFSNEVEDHTDSHLMSGIMIGVKKSDWKKMDKLKSGMLGVDNQIHLNAKKAGLRVKLMKGVYMYHWYYGDGYTNRLKDHLK